MIRVLIVDDDTNVRRGLQLCLSAEPDIHIIGEAVDGQGAVRQALALHPDVVVMDVEMPRHNGLVATIALRSQYPAAAVVMLSMHDDSATRAQAFAAGAAAFISKHDAADKLLAAIRAASLQALGESLFSKL